MWKKKDWVVVVSGTFNKSKDLKDVSFSICQILEEGLDDLLVQPQKESHWARRAFFVPKSRCKYIPIDMPDIYDDIRKPRIGDLVYYYCVDYAGKVKSTAAHVLELRHGSGEAPEAMIMYDSKQVWVSTKNLLVLDVNNEGK
tara:strand:+ start:292 stop:717 length:426 start_codon:yes stop_codon:yes gene_type:complete